MKRTLVIGAGYFGHYLICALRENGCGVDVIDKGAVPQYHLRASGCRCICNNAWNLASIGEVHIPEYDCCYICLNDNPQTNLHVIGELKKLGAQRIVVRCGSDRFSGAYLEAGASDVICPEEIAGKVLAQELAGLAD